MEGFVSYLGRPRLSPERGTGFSQKKKKTWSEESAEAIVFRREAREGLNGKRAKRT